MHLLLSLALHFGLRQRGRVLLRR